MKFLLFSDLHLDRAFGWVGKTTTARRLRDSLRQTLLAILELAVSEEVDAVLCGGDLYEHDRFTPDTGVFLRQAFAGIFPVPVYIAPGNHDWLGPSSLYRQENWSPNVHVFETASFQPVELDDGLLLWGAAHLSPSENRRFLEGFRATGQGVHLSLFHGSEENWLSAQENHKKAHGPFEAAEIEACGLTHAFLGHYHKAKLADWFTYPGNPHPLSFGESKDRGPVIVRVAPNGTLTREHRLLAVTPFHDVELDVTGLESRQDIRDAFHRLTRTLEGLARVTLIGTLERDVDFHAEDLSDLALELDGCIVRAGALNCAYDLQALTNESSVRGQFVKAVQGADLPEEERRRVLLTGLRALEGRSDLEVH